MKEGHSEVIAWKPTSTVIMYYSEMSAIKSLEVEEHKLSVPTVYLLRRSSFLLLEVFLFEISVCGNLRGPE